MGAEGEVYILRPDEETATGDDNTWVSPQPAADVIFQAVADEVDASPDEFESLSEYVDRERLVELFDPDQETDEIVTFEVEDTEVTVHESGDVEVIP